MLLGRKKKADVIVERPKRTFAIYSPYGVDVSSISVELAQAAGDKSVIVEFPCLGIPRLSTIYPDYQFNDDKTMDKLLLDFERNSTKPFDHYVQKFDGFDAICIDPKVSPDLPTILKVNHTRSMLELPGHVRETMLQYYQTLIFSLQGQLVHPMTFYSLRTADVIVVYFDKLTEMTWALLTYQKLMEDYSVSQDRMLLYSPVKNITLPVPVMHSIKDVLQHNIEALASQTIATKKEYTEHRGFINPVEHKTTKAVAAIDQAQLSVADHEQRKKLTTKVRIMLRDKHHDEFVQSIYNEAARQKVRYYIADFIKEQKDVTFQTSLDRVTALIQTEITEMGVLEKPLKNNAISSLEINSPTETIVEENGVPRHDKSIQFQDVEHIYSIISKMLLPIGKTLSANEPVIDANYRGFRICVTLERSRGGVSANTPTISIRKFPPDVYSNEACIEYGNMSKEIVEFFQDIYPCNPTTVVCGGTNSGKTSQLIRIPLYLPEITKMITIEDSEEMMLKMKKAYQDYPNIVAMIVKDHENERKRYDIGKLVKTTLRQNPDWIMIGEIRDSFAAIQALEAANTGHAIATTIHANSAEMGAVRLMQLAGNNEIAASQVSSTVNLIIYQANDHGKRRIIEISEIISFEDGKTPKMNQIFVYDPIKGEHIWKNKLMKMKGKLIQQRAPQEVVERWCV